MGYSLRLTARVILYASSHRQDNRYHSFCYTSREALAGRQRTRELGCFIIVQNIYLKIINNYCFKMVFSFLIKMTRTQVNSSLSYFSFQRVLHDWCNKGRCICYPVCGMVHIKEPLLLIDKSSLCGGSGFLFSLSEWSLTICLTP